MFTLSVGPTGIWTSGLPLGEPSPIELTGRLTKVFEIEKLLQAVDRKAKGTEILSSTLKWDLPPWKRLLFQ